MAAPVPAAETGTPQPGAAVLVVEDDDDVAALVVDMLAQLGHHPTRVSTAAAALGALADGRPVDLLFSDVLMPGGMDGLGLAREAARRRPGIRVLLTTGYTGGGPAAAPLGVPRAAQTLPPRPTRRRPGRRPPGRGARPRGIEQYPI